MTLPPPLEGGATDEGSLVLVRLRPRSLAGQGFRKLGARLPFITPFPNGKLSDAWLTTLNQLVLSGNIPWDFDLSELATKMSILLRYPTRRKSSTGNLEEAVQLHADSSMCHLERACLEQPETIVSKVVFFELSHTLPCCKAYVSLTFPWLLHMLGCFWHIPCNHRHCHTNTHCPQKGISLLPDHHVLSVGRRTNSKPRLTPFSLNFCFGLDSPSEIRTWLFVFLCLGVFWGWLFFVFCSLFFLFCGGAVVPRGTSP